MDYKLGQVKGLQSGEKRLQNGVGITNWGRDYKSVRHKYNVYFISLFIIRPEPQFS